MKLENFSSGYYRASMQVEPYDGGPSISCDTFEQLNREYYGGTDSEPMFRLDIDGSPYFTTSCEYSIPHNVLGIPSDWFQDTSAERQYTEVPVYILKPQYAYLLDDAMNTGSYPEDIVVDVDDDLLGDFDTYEEEE